MPKALSWSELSAWSFDRDKWYSQYILGEEEPPNDLMKLGKICHLAIADEKYSWLMAIRKELPSQNVIPIRKLLNKVQRFPEREFYRRSVDFQGIPLTFYFDGLDRKNRILGEYKTTDNNEKWQQFSVDYNEQLSFYALVFHLLFHRFFSDIQLHRLNTKSGSIKVFHTARGKRDLDYIGQKIKTAVNEMKFLGLYEKRLDKRQRALESQGKLNLAH